MKVLFFSACSSSSGNYCFWGNSDITSNNNTISGTGHIHYPWGHKCRGNRRLVLLCHQREGNRKTLHVNQILQGYIWYFLRNVGTHLKCLDKALLMNAIKSFFFFFWLKKTTKRNKQQQQKKNNNKDSPLLTPSMLGKNFCGWCFKIFFLFSQKIGSMFKAFFLERKWAGSCENMLWTYVDSKG